MSSYKTIIFLELFSNFFIAKAYTTNKYIEIAHKLYMSSYKTIIFLEFFSNFFYSQGLYNK